MAPDLLDVSQAPDAVDALIAEYLLARDQGQAPARAAWLAQHPDHAVELALFLDDLECMSPAHAANPPPATVQSGGAILDDAFEYGALTMAPGFHYHGHDGAAYGGGFAGLKRFDGADCAAVFVTPGPMKQQLANGADLEPGQMCGSLGSNPTQASHWRIEWTWNGSLHAAS